MPSLPLGSTNGRTTSGVACQHQVWVAHTVERRRAWHASIAFGQHTRSKDVERGMTSPPLDNARGRTTSGATCHHRLWKAHTVERRRAWHTSITIGQHKQSNGVGRGMPSSPLNSKHDGKTSAVACIIAFGQHTRLNDVGRGMLSWPLDSTPGQTTSGVACHHSPLIANTVERHWA